MLFVLEGCDGAGKTTIAKHLKNILPGAEIVHCTRETPNDFEFFCDLIDASRDRHIIADRFCYGQFVYQTQDERKLTRGELLCLESRMLGAGAKVIFVSADTAEIEDRLKYRGEKTDVPVTDICNRYAELFESTLIKPYLWWAGSDC